MSTVAADCKLAVVETVLSIRRSSVVVAPRLADGKAYVSEKRGVRKLMPPVLRDRGVVAVR